MGNIEKHHICMNILVNCEKWSIPGVYGCFPSIRALIFNNFGCFFQKKGSLGIALNYFIKALKLISTCKNKEYKSLTHMNMGGLLIQLEE